MDAKTTGPRVASGRQLGIGRRLRTGAVGVIAVGGTIVMGGAATLVTASAHHVSSTTSGTGTRASGSDFVAGISFPVGTQIMDSAALAQYTIDPARSVVFHLYGPANPTCSGEGAALATFTDTPTGVTGAAFAGPVFAGPYTTTMLGTYHWTAEVTVHGVRESGPTACADEPETTTQATPRVNTTPTAGGTVGIAIGDTATVSGGSAPTGTVTFNLYGPGDVSCTAAPLYTDVAALSAGQAASGRYTTLAVGTYSWTAKYSGDANNHAAGSGCEAENVTTTQAETAISTTPSVGGTVGVAIHDTATVSHGVGATGTVTFTLFGAGNTSCAGSPVFTSTTVLAGGSATSGSYVTTAVGTYSWVVSYSGDANNGPSTSRCTLETATTTSATPATPAISTLHSAGGAIGVSLSDTAVITGGSSPTGTVTFSLYAPSNPTCSAAGGGPLYTSAPVSLSGGQATSGSFATTAASGAGTYQWMATYSGDAHNRGLVSACTMEAVVVTSPGGVQAIATPTTGASGGVGSGLLLLLAGFGIMGCGAALPRRRSI